MKYTRPKWLFHNFGLKMVAFIFAIVYWVYIQGELGVNLSKYTRGYLFEERVLENVPIDILVSFNNTYDISVQPSIVDILLEGKPEHLKRVLRKDLIVYVDLREIHQTGVFHLPVHIEHLPDELSLGFELPIVDVFLEEKISIPPGHKENLSPNILRR